jgi:hypothetical protein
MVDPHGRIVFASIRPSGSNLDVPRDDSLDIRRVAGAGHQADLIATIRRGAGGNVMADSTPTALYLPVVDEGDAWTVTSTGSVMIIRANGTVEWHDGTGVRKRALGWPRRTYDETERRALRRVADSLFGKQFGISKTGDNPPAIVAELTMVAPGVPTQEPLFVPESLIADMRGRVWLRLGVRQLYRNPQPPEYVVLDGSGMVVDRVVFPEGESLAGFASHEIFTARIVDGRCRITVYRY